MHPDEKSKIEEVANKCFMKPSACFPIELRKTLECKDGYNWTQWEFSALLDNDQKPLGILCVGFDITGPGHNNIKYKESENRLTKTLEAIPHPLLIINDKSVINYVNNEFEFVFDYTIDEIVGEKFEILYPEVYKINH